MKLKLFLIGVTVRIYKLGMEYLYIKLLFKVNGRCGEEKLAKRILLNLYYIFLLPILVFLRLSPQPIQLSSYLCYNFRYVQ